jgi:hypothetical protein
MKELSEYEKQAQAFLDKFGITFKATWKGDKCPPWVTIDPKANGSCRECGHIHGDRFRVEIGRDRLLQRTPLSFDFWNSFHAKSEGTTELDAYHVLSSISNDVHCPDTFEDFCAEYGYDEDSRKAFATFKRCARFAERLQAFFSEEEQDALGEIS